MEFQASTLWWVLAGALVIAELLTGTFYLLMLALGSVAAAVAAHAGATGSGQFVAAALVGGGATAAWHFKRARAPRSAPAASKATSALPALHTSTPRLPMNLLRSLLLVISASSLGACAVVAVADAAVTVAATGVKVVAKTVGAVVDVVTPEPKK